MQLTLLAKKFKRIWNQIKAKKNDKIIKFIMDECDFFFLVLAVSRAKKHSSNSTAGHKLLLP